MCVFFTGEDFWSRVDAAHEVWGGHLVFISCERQHAGADVELEDANGVRVLVGDNKPLPRRVELEVARCFAPRVLDDRLFEKARVLVDRVDAHRVMPAVRNQDKPTG